MMQQVKSRTQRRMEKKQAILLVVLLFGIALVSFFLGILVGRSGSSPESSSGNIAATPLPVTPPAAEEVPTTETTPAPTAAVEGAPEEKEPLTFYDALPEGQNPPLGSGINLPPQAKPAAKPEPPIPAASTATVPEPLPKSVAQGTYIVQAASFRKMSDASALRDRLTKKGYAASLQNADLGDKGVWYRVMVGPYAAKDEAAQIAARLSAEEKLSGMVKKQ